MERMRSVLPIFFVMEILFGFSMAHSQQEVQNRSFSGIKFIIQSDKKTYRLKEKITIDLQITNMTDVPLQVTDLNNAGGNVMVSRTLLFGIVGPDGKEVPYAGAKEDWYPRFDKHGRWLNPKESMRFSIKLNDDASQGYYLLSQLGHYQITGRYYGFSAENTLSRSGIFSNTITVYISGDM